LQVLVTSSQRRGTWKSSIALAAFFWTVGASADTVAPGEEGELLKFLPAEPAKHICFARAYSADHLARHPKQKVTEIEFRLAYHRFDPDEFFPAGQRNYYFEVLATLRGEPGQLTGFGECSPDGDAISCSVDCDGGGIRAKRTATPGTVLLYFGGYDYLRMSGGCDGGEGGELVPGEDDKEFLLTERAAESCPAYEDW
jgi:hypothetical protein